MALKRKKKAEKQNKKPEKAKRAKRNDGRIGRVGRELLLAFNECDYRILIMVGILTAFGLMMVYSAGYYTTSDPFASIKKQGLFAVTGFVLLCFAACYDYHKYATWYKAVVGLSILLLVLVLLIGSSANGSQRWISLGPVSITPSEFSKLFVIIFSSCYLAIDPNRIKGKGLIPLFAVMGVHGALIIMQPNLSSAIVVLTLMAAIMFVAGLAWRWVLGACGLALGVGLMFVTVLRDTYWYTRICSFSDPFEDMQGSGYQVCQSLIALGNGGLKGLGLGNSTTKNLYLPEPQNDFILAVIGEELGYIGFIVLMLAYIVLFFMLIRTAMRAKDRLGCYLATGVAVMLALHVAINVAVVTSSMPPTGITLPFVSYGGSSMWIFMYSIGVALNVSRGQKQNRKA